MKKLTTEEFILRSNHIHNSKYDYSLTIYKNKRSKVFIICTIHGIFEQLAGNHICGLGCAKCNVDSRTTLLQNFISKAQFFHGKLYDYSQTIYLNNHTKIIIICPIHGAFKQIPSDHYNHGCNQCAIENRAKDISLTQEEFINRSKLVHNDKYDYSLVKYNGTKTKIQIICKKHGVFEQKPSYHLQGCDCPICSKAGVSQMETNWLNEIGILSEYRQFNFKIDGKKIKADGYDPITNTIYEFYGDFWHGNPIIYDPGDINYANNIKFGILYQNTIERENLIKSANYNMIVKWQTEF